MTTLLIATVTICGILIYILSAYLFWLFIHIAHSGDGIWPHSNPVPIDLIIMFFPVLNTFFGISVWIISNPFADNKGKLYRFFKIQK